MLNPIASLQFEYIYSWHILFCMTWATFRDTLSDSGLGDKCRILAGKTAFFHVSSYVRDMSGLGK